MGTVKLNDSFTLFLYPFRITGNFLSALENNSLWTKSTVSPDPSFFFPHIHSFFTENISKSIQEADKNQLITYEVKSQNLNETDKEKLFLFKNLFGRTHQIPGKDGNIEFTFSKDSSILSPTLFIIPLTQIGILTYGVELKNDQTLSSFLDLNYRLRIFSSGQVQEILTARKEHPNAQAGEEIIQQKLSETSEAKPEKSTHFSWKIPQWIDYLLSGVKEHTSILSPSRLQAFTYLSLAESLEGEDLEIALFRLRRIYSEKYLPSSAFINDRSEISQTFDQVIYGASSEGAVVLAKKDEKEFLKNYRNTVLHRTIWSYLLAYHQRFAMIAAAADTNALFINNQEPNVQQLSDLIDRISKVQLKCLFHEISHYTQQNEFYYLATKNLKVDALFHEVKDEVEEMNKILTEKWREQERVNREAEEEKARKNQKKIEILLALLILPQIWLAILSTNITAWQKFIDANTFTINLINGLIWFTILGAGLKLFLTKKT